MDWSLMDGSKVTAWKWPNGGNSPVAAFVGQRAAFESTERTDRRQKSFSDESPSFVEKPVHWAEFRWHSAKFQKTRATKNAFRNL